MTMNITHFFRRISGLFIENETTLLRNDYQSIKNKINSFPEPLNDMDRALCQYECTMKRMNAIQRLVMNAGSFVMYLPYYICFTHNSVKQPNRKYDAVFYKDKISIDIVPNSLRKQYPDILTLDIGITKEMSLDKSDKQFLKKIRKKKPCWFYFHLKVMMKLAMTSYCIRMYQPKALISHFEESFASSLMAGYCERKGIKYIGVMHGERLYSLKLSFFRCTEYYAWDRTYVDLFCSMRCEKSQFRVEVPNALQLPEYKRKQDAKYDYTFYLQEENEKNLKVLQSVCHKLISYGMRIAVRPHPRFSNLNFKKYFPETDIQWSQKVTLTESFSETKAVVARFSTTLYQAWFLGIPIVIDDCTLPKQFERLKDLRYVMLEKPHKLLSEILAQIDKENNK